MGRKTERIFTEVSNIREYLDVLKSHGDKVLYRYPVGNQYVSMTYSQFHTQVLDTAAGLKSLGLAGKRIAVIGPTSPEWVSSYLAVLASGGVIIPMDKELDATAIAGFLETAEAEAIFYGKGTAVKLAGAMESHATMKLFISMENAPEDEKKINLSAVIEKGKAEREAVPFEIHDGSTEDLAVMLFTSGTTGTAKCVMLCQKNIWATLVSACSTVEFFHDDTIVSVLPLHHTYELICMLSGMDYGMTIGINDTLTHIMKNFAEYKPTGLVLVPLFITTMYNKIMAKAKAGGKEKILRVMLGVSGALRKIGIDLRRVFFKSVLDAFGGRLCKIVSGAAPLNPEMVKAFDGFGITIAEGYGITECSPLISVNPYYALKKGSVGPAVPCCTVRIDVRETNDKGYAEGEIQVKGDNVMLGYYKNEEENKRAFTEDGWYRTGDVGYMDKDGYIYITGRLKSVIVLENGKNVFPEEIEEYLGRIEEIGECVVVGRKADDGETVNICALVYPNTDIYGETPDKEKAYSDIMAKITELNRQLPTFKKIKALEIVDAPFEKTTTRKIKRHLVK
ncbi:MAG: AMP-binding protein [Clostridia bacterium]|nr:AMP-binding protein [Clostridia bacterium]